MRVYDDPSYELMIMRKAVNKEETSDSMDVLLFVHPRHLRFLFVS